MKVKMEEISKNDTKCIKKTKNKSKNGGISYKERQKRANLRKLNFLLYYATVCFLITLTSWCWNTMEGYYELYDIVYRQSHTIDNLIEWLQANENVSFSGEIPEELVSYMCLGNFEITHYCACTKCCGKNAQGITASGKRVEENKTIAVDPKVIPLGTKVYINGHEYEAQDTGSAIKGNKIDIYVADHEEALKLGVKYADVYVKK